MGKGSSNVEDIEEGEISDEEQSIEDVKQREEELKEQAKKDSRVWVDGLYKYNSSTGTYHCSLHNLAWAQAVQNKPLIINFNPNEIEKEKGSDVLANSKDDNLNKNESFSSSKDVSSEKIGSKMVDSDDVEEGELEEGEMDLVAKMVAEGAEGTEGVSKTLPISNVNVEKINSIRKALKTITATDFEKSFDRVCSELRVFLDSLRQIVSKSGVTSVIVLVQECFVAIEDINTVFCSMNQKQQESNKDVFSRLLAHVKSQCFSLFSPEQMKKVEMMIHSVELQFISSNVEKIDTRKVMQEKTGVNGNELGTLGAKLKEVQHTNIPSKKEMGILGENTIHASNFSKGFLLEPIFVNTRTPSGIMSSGPLSASRGRGMFGPLLDLHKDHDVDSLPSPTGQTPTTPFSTQKPWVVENGPVKSGLTITTVPDRRNMHLYETDALKAVSTYQQKFGSTSFPLSTDLPSPTPSGECNDGGDDPNGEVSSSTVGNGGTINPFIPTKTTISATPDGFTRQGIVPAVQQLESGKIPALRSKGKNRDPRLQFLDPEANLSQQHPIVEHNAHKDESFGGLTSLRKNKTVPESELDGHISKRQRNMLSESAVSGDVQMSSGIGGWLEESSTRTQLADRVGSDPRKLRNGEQVSGLRQDSTSNNFKLAMGGNGSSSLKGSGTGTSNLLPSLLKDIAVNPSMLLDLIKEQQRLAAENQQKSSNVVQGQNRLTGSSLNASPGAVPLASITSFKSSDIGQKPEIKTQIPGNTIPMVEFGKIRMKPRDPRRVLHDSTFQKNECLGSEQFKTTGVISSSTQPSKVNAIVGQQGEQAQRYPFAPDISQQFTNELQNLANIVTSTQTTSSPSEAPQAVSSPTVPTKTDITDSGTVDGSVGPSRNTWEDVQHLFGKYDDEQRAAIQRERVRRIDEQSKMFAARKLCLVLDLDHTLLNSAKFVEVDPMHEEILRKKEEQDREKPYRHLFRFPHMGMWTKLRPGVWNFLEKASKLFELHLYTMGNKLYATEMAKVLDPTKALFAGRVISKGDEGGAFDGDDRVPKSKDLEGVLGMESSVVIIDDSARVWPHHKPNLIVVERYTYFPCSRRQFGLLGPSLLEIDHDERPEEGTLASSLGVIERIHQNFFHNKSLHDIDVRDILASEQRKILSGCRIVFSRIFPVGEANPHLHPLWQSAEQFGASCTTQIDEKVTHVVANSLGTDKVNWALSTGRFVVHPSWVEASTLLYKRANEQDFAVKI